MSRKDIMLVDKKEISYLFQKGKIHKSFPVLAYYMENESNKVLFSVPKSVVKKSVNRNKIKRQLRTIYFETISLKSYLNFKKTIAFVYISNKIINSHQLEQNIQNILKAIKNEK